MSEQVSHLDLFPNYMSIESNVSVIVFELCMYFDTNFLHILFSMYDNNNDKIVFQCKPGIAYVDI